MFAKDFLTASLSKEELTKRLKAVLEETGSWPQGENTEKLKFIAKDIGESALQKHASFDIRLLVACIAADILRVFAPDAPYDRSQLQSIFSLFLSSFYQLCNPTTLPRAFYLLERLVSVKAFSLAAAEEISEDMLENLLATISSICQKGVVVTAESLLADCIVDFTEECDHSSMSTMLLDTFFEPISTCKNFDTNQNARVFSYSLQRSPALQDAASQYLFDLKQKIGIESDLRDNVIDIIATIAPIAPKALTLVMPALADDLKFDDSEVRSKVVSLLGKVFSSTGAYVSEFPELLKEFLGRINDKLVSVRSSVLSIAIDLVKSHPSTMPDICAVLISALNDGEEKIRKIALNVVCENFKLLQQSGDANILKEAGKRMRDKKASIRKEAMQLFATIYQKAPAKEREGTYGWIVNLVLGNARDTDSSDVRGEVDSILDEKFLPESSSPSAVFSSVTALLANLDDAGFAGLDHLLNNKARIASELRRACVMVCQSGADPALLSSCIKNLASFLPESLKAADQLEAVFAYSSIKLAPKLLECLDVVHDSSELRKRKRELDKKFGPRSSLQDFLDELFIHFQIGLFDCRWVQGLLSSVATHEISPSAMKLTKVLLTSFPKTASACNAIILDCIQNEKIDSSVALRAVHSNAESFRGNSKITNAAKHLCASRNHKIAKLASRAFIALEGQTGADALVQQTKDNLDVDERCVAALSVLQQCAVMFPLSIMQFAVDISRFVVQKLAGTSVVAPTGGKASKSAKATAASVEWLAQAKVIGIKLLGILSCCAKHQPDVAKFALKFYREVINADGAIGDAETTEEFRAESRLECGKAFLRIAACPDISSHVSYGDLHLVAGLIEDVDGSVKKPFAKHLYKSLITRKTGATLPWRFAAIFSLAAIDADRDFAAQAQLLLKQTVTFMRTMYRRASSAGTVTAAHLLPERILPMVVHLLAHHPDFVAAKTSDADRYSIAKKSIGSVMEALASGPE
jgi:sister-chromatid-cohesion protein PDS5